jgi:hypothetical protein
VLALEVACIPASKPHKNASTAYIPWSLVEEIRRVLELRGISWRALQEPIRDQVWGKHGRWIEARMAQRRAIEDACEHKWAKSKAHTEGDSRFVRCVKCHVTRYELEDRKRGRVR